MTTASKLKLVLAMVLVMVGSQARAKTQPAQPAQLEAVRQKMRDPESVRFRHTYVGKRDERLLAICGEMNAKNGFGGYTGFQPFYADLIAVGRAYIATLYTTDQFSTDRIYERCEAIR